MHDFVQSIVYQINYNYIARVSRDDRLLLT
jgi:hypothetical protein